MYSDHKSVPPTWIRQRKKDGDLEQYLDDEDDEEGIDLSFSDGQITDQTTHTMPIAQKIFESTDEEGFCYQLLEEIRNISQ